MTVPTYKIAALHTEDAKNELNHKQSFFSSFTFRQKALGSPHNKTKCIPLRASDLSTVTQNYWQNSLISEFTDLAKEFPEALKLCRQLMTIVNGYRMGSVLIVSLPPGKSIGQHTDEGVRAKYYDRFHIILQGTQTWGSPEHKEITLTEMSEGEAWWVDNCQEHYVINQSNIARIAIIVDIQL